MQTIFRVQDEKKQWHQNLYIQKRQLNYIHKYIKYIMSALNNQIIAELNQTIKQNPYINQLTLLQYKQIHNLQPYIQYLRQLRHLKKLSLYGNHLQFLPMSLRELTTVQQLNLAKNQLDKFDARQNIQSLKQMPNLKTLIYPIDKSQEKLIIQSIPTLKYLNNTKIITQKRKQAYEMKYLNQRELGRIREKINERFKEIVEFQKEYLDDIDPQSMEKFDSQNNMIITEAIKKVKNSGAQISQSLETIIFILTRYDLYDNLKARALNVCMDTYGELGKFLKDMSDQQQKIFKQLATQALNLSKVQYDYLEAQKQKVQVEDGNLENKVFIKNAKLQKEIKRLKKQNDEYRSEINHLESLNKQYLDTMFRHAMGEKNAYSGYNFQSGNTTKNHISVPTHIVKPIQQRKPAVPTHHITNPSNTTFQQNSHSSLRMLTLKQLKETIDEIYESKLKFDQKNFDGKIPRETMHQYLFTYLNQKYGLKNLTIQAANSIVSGIQAYSPEDNDVAVFGKILKNQVDEEFRNVQSELKSTVSNLLKMHIKSQSGYKSAAEIHQLYNQKLNGQITLQQSTDIIKYLYNKSDAERLLKKIDQITKTDKPKQTHTRRLPHKEQNQQNNSKSKQKIKFSRFMKAVLDFQLKNHEELLKPLVKVFKARDRDYDGIVDEDQFIRVIEELCEEADQIMPELLMIVDPYESKAITFTQVVRLVANYPENNPILSRFLEDKADEEDYD